MAAFRNFAPPRQAPAAGHPVLMRVWRLGADGRLTSRWQAARA